MKLSVKQIYSLCFSTVLLLICLLTWLAVITSAQALSPTVDNSADQYMVEFKGQKLPSDLSARIASLGGTIIDSMPEINVVIVGNLTNTAVAFLRTQVDVADVTTDEFISPISEAGHRAINAAQKVSGLAALLVAKLGHGHAAQVRAAIENSTDDLGKPGVDPIYGMGRINIAHALRLQ